MLLRSLLVLQLVAVFLVGRRRLPEASLWQLVLLAAAVPLLTPTAWVHYFVHLAFAPLLLLRWAADGGRGTRSALAALALSVLLSSVAAFGLAAALLARPDRPAWLVVHHYGVVAAANLALIAA